MINAFFWFISILLIIVFLGCYFGFYAIDDESQPWVLFIACVVGTSVFIPSNIIFSGKTPEVIWKIMVSLCMVTSFVAIFLYKNPRKRKMGVYATILVILVGVIPFLFNLQLEGLHEIQFPANNYNNTFHILSLIIAVLFVFLTIIIALQIKLLRGQSKNLEKKNYNFDPSFIKPYHQFFGEEISRILLSLEDQLTKFTKNLQKQSFTANQGNSSLENNASIYKDIEKIRHILETLPALSQSNADMKFDDIREINHFLGTPFSIIEANAELLRAQSSDNSEQYIDKIISAVRTSQSIISTYKDIYSITMNEYGIISSLKEGCTQTLCSYSKYLRKDDNITYDADSIPEKIEPFNNHYLLSVLIPLIENAITAALADSAITIEYDQIQSTITITNQCLGSINISDFDKPDFSTKKDHKGTGLMIVRHLLKAKRIGTLTFEKESNNLKAIIKLNQNNE